ncbi:hypothetical protein CDL15_Pgr028617 [Punica granatum]|uniref:Uncharacterized protein n=1 Tax=Punica granatum TaxID=22663 RepID=A0A218VXU7_PUNGR|nr:hypothetical protein CDL15_Pgr028617 [Punica granatum]PKI54032.1 hypothetical protein CRG98_025579 [Punica granatum]
MQVVLRVGHDAPTSGTVGSNFSGLSASATKQVTMLQLWVGRPSSASSSDLCEDTPLGLLDVGAHSGLEGVRAAYCSPPLIVPSPSTIGLVATSGGELYLLGLLTKAEAEAMSSPDQTNFLTAS